MRERLHQLEENIRFRQTAKVTGLVSAGYCLWQLHIAWQVWALSPLPCLVFILGIPTSIYVAVKASR